MKKLLSLAILLGLSLLSVAQKGSLRGNIADGQFGGPLIGATITIPALSGVGTTADFDGNYSLSLDPGTYTVQLSFISYTTQTFPDVVIKAGEVVKIDAVMEMATQKVEMVTIKAEARKDSEAGALIAMKNSTNVTDGLSSTSFRKIGDSDLSGAIKRVTGVTVQDGKYVYVRGLGDRYTKSLLNGMALPGLDPDVNSVQVDIFPTAVLENVNISKTFSPDLNGDFTGGLVNVVTKKFPETKTTQLSIGFGYVPGMTFNPDFILYTPGSIDFLGFDDGSRKLPFDPETEIPDETQNDPELESITRSFNPELAAKKRMAFMNSSFSFNHGNQINKESGSTVGYNFVLNYNNQNVFYEDFESNDYLKSTDFDINDLDGQRFRKGDVGRNSVMWNALATTSWKKKNNTVTATLLYNQSGESSAAKRVSRDVEQNQATLIEDVLTYTQRSLGTFQLNGEHRVNLMEMNWANSFSISRVYDPDFRESRISVTDGDTALTTGNGAGIDRFWRDLNEMNESVKFDVKIPVHKDIKLKTGAIYTFKTRTFSVYSYKHRPNNLSDIELDPDWFLQEENIWSTDPTSSSYLDGTFTIGNFQLANQYDASSHVAGAYLMAEQTIAKKLNLIYGARFEYALMFYRGRNANNTEVYLDENTLNAPSILPALNIVFKATDKMNVRTGYSRTVARPSFKEKSIAEIYDPITKRTFIGNIDLKQTNIDNVDLRYEYFIGGKDMLSVSGFYKRFVGHIELVSFNLAPDNLKPRNSGLAQVFGGEIEIRKGLRQHTSNKFLQGFFFAANASIVKSMVDMKSVIINNNGDNEFDNRTSFLRDGETLDQFRPMTGQSPYAVNGSIGYEFPNDRGNLNIAYNVQGDQLTIIGSGRVPDIYTVAFHQLNFNMYINLGKERRSRVTMGVQNLLDDDRTLVYRSYKAEDQIFTTFKPGRTISLKYRYSF